MVTWPQLWSLASSFQVLETSLIANRLQGWKNEADTAKDLESEIENNQGLRAELDELLLKLNAIIVAEKALSKDNRKWFEEILRIELYQMGSVLQLEDDYVNDFIKTDKVIIQTPGGLDPIALRNSYLYRLFPTVPSTFPVRS